MGKSRTTRDELDIAEIRQKLGFSVSQLAAALGVRDYTVERWEKRKSKPSPLAKSAILRLLETKR